MALLAAHRQGDPNAMDELVRLHRDRTIGWARRYARNQSDVEDLVHEAFANVLGAMSRGSGPTASMGLYLASAVRHAAANRAIEQNRHLPVEDIASLLDEAVEDVPAGAGEVSSAFETLPLRWRQILWLRDVEGLKVNESAEIMGLTPTAATQLHKRARGGLRSAYLELLAGQPGTVCRVLRPQLRNYVRGAVHRKDRAQLDEHVSSCVPCAEAVAALRTVRPRVVLLLPLALLLTALNHQKMAAAVAATLAVVAVAVPLGVAGGSAGEVTPDETSTSSQAVLTAGADDGCRVLFVPGGPDGPQRFEAEASSETSCWVSFSWNTQMLTNPTLVADRTIVLAPRSGTYTVVLTSGASTSTTQHEVP